MIIKKNKDVIDFSEKIKDDLIELEKYLKERNKEMLLTERDRNRVFCFDSNKEY